MLMKPSASTSVSVVALCIFCFFFGLVHVGEAQNNQTQAATDPNEGKFTHWTFLVRSQMSYGLWLPLPICMNLGQNFLTGPLSPSIANLTAMQYLTLGINALSGVLPKELGLLSELIVLGIGTNNFSGPLPPELGNLTKLEQLRLQGNSFEGPIPSSFSNLTSLTELRISDLSNGSSSSLAFVRDMKSLSTLELRNNNISDTIPSNIGDFQTLQHLDLSFNNISGQIPSSLFNLSSLTHLFLGNNKLNGTLPAEKHATLLNIDVSYNNLLGSFPSWIKEENLQLNLVANNFTLKSSNSSVLPYGLNCLQRNFPCNRGSPIYSSFAVKSGGPQIKSSNDIVYERDNETLGPATYYVPDTDRWGVSNVGYFTGSSNPQYKIFSQSQFINTLDSEIFQTARISASSLRYYGLGLENGNYTVTLPGNRVEKDFNIKSVASGIPRRAFQREYKAQVSENYLEIHFFWAGKGTCCVPSQGYIWAFDFGHQHNLRFPPYCKSPNH
ncbi:hypothetical protein Pint_18180 [Pistacia integerrima]|uniref:Uncharacterized protein n=1 Tax=Pistacia integerrima TaxID=434235 RepID=A0ACC0YXK5_9ROSI|nr:hypothetical protein Pint_18180 [Pistacia integerrima]